MNAVLHDTIDYVFRTIFATCGQLFVLLGPGLLLAFVMNMIALSVRRLAVQSLGPGLYLGLFGWLGTAIHELGHVVFCMIFGHRIIEVNLFDPRPDAPQLGYVKFGYDPRNPYQQIGKFFAGLGPILFGTGVIYCAFLALLAPHIERGSSGSGLEAANAITHIGAVLENTYHLALAILAAMFNPGNLLNWRFYLFVYIAFAVGSSITLSDADIEGASSGFAILVLVAFLFNLCTLWLGTFADDVSLYLSQLYAFFYAIMLFVIVINLVLAVLLSLSLRLARL